MNSCMNCSKMTSNLHTRAHACACVYVPRHFESIFISQVEIMSIFPAYIIFPTDLLKTVTQFSTK